MRKAKGTANRAVPKADHEGQASAVAWCDLGRRAKEARMTEAGRQTLLKPNSPNLILRRGQRAPPGSLCPPVFPERSLCVAGSPSLKASFSSGLSISSKDFWDRSWHRQASEKNENLSGNSLAKGKR